jgi:hypothetical protein
MCNDSKEVEQLLLTATSSFLFPGAHWLHSPQFCLSSPSFPSVLSLQVSKRSKGGYTDHLVPVPLCSLGRAGPVKKNLEDDFGVTGQGQVLVCRCQGAGCN